MFRTKRDVDRHVSYVLTRIRDENERNSRGYQFAKLYHDVADYTSAKRYLQAYLSVREAVPEAHKLMGQINEGLKDKDAAIESFKRSLDLDPEQKDVILKVCELYGDVGVRVNKDVAELWIERAERYFPNEKAIFKLKERVVGKDGDMKREEMEHLLTSELMKSPGQVDLHIKLLRLYIQFRDVEKAFEHAVKTEKTLTFVNCTDWYECLLDVFQVYGDQQGNGASPAFHIHRMFAAANHTLLKLKSDERETVKAIKSLQQLDTSLYEAGQLSNQSESWTEFLTEMKGQLFYLSALLLLKRAIKGQLSWKDASMFSSLCFLLSGTQPAVDTKASWAQQAKPDWKKFYEHVYTVGCDRLSQGGHTLLANLKKQDVQQTLRSLRQKVSTAQGRSTLYSLLFTGPDVGRRKDTSFLLTSDIFTSTDMTLPVEHELRQYDAVACKLHLSDLNHLVWLATQHYSLKEQTQPDYERLFGVQLFPEMKFSIPDLSTTEPASLCQLDAISFLYVTVHWSMMQGKEGRRTVKQAAPDKPSLLPACLSQALCSKQQAEWWSAVSNMKAGQARGNLSSVWKVISRGLETIRLVVPNALFLPLVVHLARTLDTRVSELESLDEEIQSHKLTGLQGRAEFYWLAASDILDRSDRNQGVRAPKEILFPSDSIIDPALKQEIRGQVQFALATFAMKREDHEEALQLFESIHTPEAAFYTGMIFHTLADSDDQNNSSATGHHSQQMALLTRSKTALYQALDRLETAKNEELLQRVKRELDDVQCRLIPLEMGSGGGGNLVDSILCRRSNADADDYEEQESEDDSDAEPVKPASFHHTPSRTPNRMSSAQSVVSPTRLDMQFKMLETTNSALLSRINGLEETVRNTNTMMSEILAQLRQTRDENKTLKEHFQMLSLQGLSNMSLLQQQQQQQRVATTPQPARVNPATPGPPINMTPYGGAPAAAGIPGLYDYPGQAGLPAHMAQYGLPPAASPRTGSVYAQPTFDDPYSQLEPEFDPDGDQEYYISDQNLVQEWPFGHKAGVEGKSTITYSPQAQQQLRGAMNPASAGMFAASALRGPSIQYGAGYPAQMVPPQPAPAAQLPGPGYFSQNNISQNPMSGAGLQVQASMVPGQFGIMQQAGTQGVPSAGTMPKQVTSTPAPSSKPSAPMMPPNAVIPTQSSETRPKLLPGSVGVPVPNQGSPAGPTTLKPTAGPTGASIVQGAPQSAAGLLSSLASKHQEDVSKAVSPIPPASTPQKVIVKGLTFTSTPKINDVKPEKDEKPAPTATTAPAAKPFSGFSFTTPKPATGPVTVSSSASPAVITSVHPAQSPAQQFQMGSGSSPSFGSLAAADQTADAFTASGDQRGFFGAGTPLFGKSPTQRRRNTSAGSDDHVEEYEPNVDFKPVIQLPDLVEVKTGEEEENRLFCERAKLFRFDTESNQWKERGLGDLKILQHKQTKAVRILMRREQVLKLCANHILSADMKLTPLASSDKAWVWNAMDYSEGEMKAEKLAAKFKNSDLADRFQKVFKKCQDDMTSEGEGEEENVEAAPDTPDTKGQESGKCDLADMFKKKPGQWTCDGCFVVNNSDILKCPCCQTLQPGVKPEDVKSQSSGFGSFGGGGKIGGTGSFTFGSQSASPGQPSGGRFSFGGSSSSSTEQSGSGFKVAGSAPSTAPQSGTGFKFGSPATNSTATNSIFGSPASASTTSSASIFGSSTSTSTTSSGSIFGATAGNATTSAPAPVFGTSATGGFKFGTNPSAAPDASSSTGGLFGTPTSATTTTGSSLFGNKPAVTSSTSVFGSTTTSTTATTGFMFGSASSTSAPASGIFGSKTSTASDTKTGSAFIFGGTLPGTAPSSGVQDVPAVTSPSKQTEDTQKTNPGDSLLARYLSSPDNWKCPKCSKNNDGVVEACPGCFTPRPDEEDSTSELLSKPASFGGSLLKDLASSPPKPVFGVDASKPPGSAGFAFGQPQNTGAKGFAFTSTSKPSAGFQFTFPPTGDSTKAQPAASLGSGFNFSMSMSPAKKDATPVKGSPVKAGGLQSPKSPEVNEEGYYVNKEGDDSHIYFEPVIDLPDQVEVKTGEEDEEVLFSYRAKLFRFVNSEWKERGLGDIKVLYNSDTNKARVLMRREQILKLCCNHYVTSDLKLQPMPNSHGKALVWAAMDFSDGESKDEKFSVKFKSEEVAQKFAKAVECAQGRTMGAKPKSPTKPSGGAVSPTKSSGIKPPAVENIGARDSPCAPDDSDGDVSITDVDKATPEQVALARKWMLPDHFYLYENKPPCQGCRGCDEDWSPTATTTEDEGDTYADDEEEDDDDDDDDDDDYEDEETEEEDEEGEDKGDDDNDGDDDGDDNDGDDDGDEKTGEFVFGKQGGAGLDFAALAHTKPAAFTKDSGQPFSWQGAGQKLFGAGKGASGEGPGGDNGDGEVEQGADVHFEPIIPLPELIDVKTGEEDEKVLYSQRSKLYRFDSGAWKEKGIGEMKILRHKQTGKYRLLLRREQVHKLACNHHLTTDLNFTSMNTSETTWCWTAQDFSENEPKLENFAIKFKTVDLAHQFKAKIDEIQNELKDSS